MAAKAGGARGGGSPDVDTNSFETVNLPHDWAVGHEIDEQYGPAQGYKARGVGWYFKQFRLEEEDKNKELYIEFGGVSSHCTVYLNGSVVYRNFCGYNSFVVNITDMAVYGEQVNALAVYVNAEAIEGWWYEGAGIYRHVDLYKKNKLHIKPWGVFVNPEKKSADVWNAKTKTAVENTGIDAVKAEVRSYILDKEGNTVGKETTVLELKAGEEKEIEQDILTYSPLLWDIDSPNLYTMVSEILIDGKCVDKEENNFGFRTIAIDAENGFYLNGRNVKLYGTCNHQDHTGVGVAVPDSINEYRIKLLKEMGTNAYRCSHGNPTKEILDYCDKYGLLVMDENRNFSSSPDTLMHLRDMVLRDRNHPCVIMYSLFNEEPLQGTRIGQKLTIRMRREIEKYDDSRFILGAMNGGFMEEFGAGDECHIKGLNYSTSQFDLFREKFPDFPVTGSENNSAFQTRGVYKTDYSKNVIDCYDTVAADWGNTHRDGFKQIDTRKYMMGMFIWTGFDYRGEPTPFAYPSIATQFGIMDTCGFKKDAFYLNKAFFTDEPMIHALPHWNWSKGDTVKVMTHTNCEEAEIFINGVSKGRLAVDKYDMCSWEVEFEEGTLEMKGYRDGKEVCTDIVKTAKAPARIVIEAHKDSFKAGEDDAVAVNVSLVDENGVHCPTADNLIRFKVNGGKVLGVGNGDPNSHEADKAQERHLFNGYCQAIVEYEKGASSVIITAEADGIEAASIEIPVIESERVINYVPSVDEKYITKWRKTVKLLDEKPDPKAVINDFDMNSYETVTVPTGFEEMYEGRTGYAMYKTSFENPVPGAKLMVRDVTSDFIEIYINGEFVWTGVGVFGQKAEIELKEAGTVDVAIIMHSAEKTTRGGITKPVVLVW